MAVYYVDVTRTRLPKDASVNGATSPNPKPSQSPFRIFGARTMPSPGPALRQAGEEISLAIKKNIQVPSGNYYGRQLQPHHKRIDFSIFNMKTSVDKVRKKISKKKGNVTALHENSRDSQRLRRAAMRDEKLAKVASARRKTDQPLSNYTYL